MKISRIGEFIGRQKMRLNYGYGTLAMFGWFVLILDVLSRRFNLDFETSLFLIPFAIFGIWVFAYALDKLGFIKGEWSLAGERTSQLDDIKKSLEEVKKHVSER